MAQSQIGHEVLTANHSAARHTPGEVIEIVGSQGLKRYQYIKFDESGVTAVANGLVYYLNAANWTGYTVTSDMSDSKLNMVAGVLMAVLTDTYYGWIQTWGYNSAIKTNGDDDIAAGDALIGSTTDLGCNSTAGDTAPTNKVLGWAVDADVDAANTVAGHITLL
jgi:hypothetical protein